MSRVVIFDEFGGPDVLRVVDEPMPEPAAGEIRVRLEAIGVNRLDALVRSGDAPRPIGLPHARLGVEGTGVVDALGAGVENLEVGAPVIITAVPEMDVNGTYADYTLVEAERVVPRPADVDPVRAAALWVAYSTAYGGMIEKAGVRPADRVLVTAASSGVGLAAVQIANQIGAIPIGVTRTAAKRDAILAAGVAAVIVTEEEDLLARVGELTGGDGVDVIVDSVMGPGLADLAKAARYNGTLVSVGWLDPRPAPFPVSPPLTIHRYMSFEHTLDPTVVPRIAAFLAAGLRSGVLAPRVDRVFTLDEVADAHRRLEENAHVGKLVMTT
jgi:NADPH:quinone reductase